MSDTDTSAHIIDTARAFLRASTDTPAPRLVCLALDVNDVWFARPADGAIWAAIVALARDGTDPHLPLVRAHLLEHGHINREVETRLADIATEPFCGTQGQLAQYRRALAAEAFTRLYRDGLQALLDDADTQSVEEAMHRITALGTQLRKLANVVADKPAVTRKLKAVSA